ncbi:putative heme degradation protein [Bosea sp. BK604]|nr:putative heme degradation protein [Bosea sp. BK604]
MTEMTNPRERLRQSPADILPSLPAMGRVMLSTRSGGATHERMGLVEAVTIEGAEARLSGAFHDSRIDLATVARLVADRTSTMRERVLPRLECQDVHGEVLFSLIGLDGLEPFDKALASFGAGEALEPVERERGGGSQDVPEDDLGALSFAAILASGEAIAIDVERPGLFQHWSGALPEPKPAMGFVNIMQPDFHLHLKAGALAGWLRRETAGGIALHGLDAEGQETGLILRGPAAAFANVPKVGPADG